VPIELILSFRHFSIQGDVGGGHYYAYIRPSGAVGMDYEAFAEHVRSTGPPSSSQSQKSEGENGKDEAENSKQQKEKVKEVKEVKESLDALARNGQWLKFNDETVMKVTHLTLHSLTLPVLSCPVLSCPVLSCRFSILVTVRRACNGVDVSVVASSLAPLVYSLQACFLILSAPPLNL
jgi:hypothetical protein